jgi:hypothetical protein
MAGYKPSSLRANCTSAGGPHLDFEIWETTEPVSPKAAGPTAGGSQREDVKIAPGRGPHGQVFVRGVAGWSTAQSGEYPPNKVVRPVRACKWPRPRF